MSVTQHPQTLFPMLQYLKEQGEDASEAQQYVRAMRNFKHAWRLSKQVTTSTDYIDGLHQRYMESCARAWMDMEFDEIYDSIEFIEKYLEENVLDANRDRWMAAVVNVSMLYWQAREYEMSKKYADEAMVCDPANPNAYSLGVMHLHKEGKLLEAIDLLNKAIDRCPLQHHAAIRTMRSALRLTLGQFARGWNDFEYRLDMTDPGKRSAEKFWKEGWTPERALSGKKLVLVAEQGYGDQIMMTRYLPLCRELASNVTLYCPVEIAGLFEQNFKDCKVVPSILPPPEHDVFLHMMSLPYRFGLGVNPKARIPPVSMNAPARTKGGQRTANIPFLKEKFTDTEDRRKRVGICWAGGKKHMNDLNRSIPLAYWEPILRVLAQKNTRVIALQTGESALRQLRRLEDDQAIGEIECYKLSSFEVTAALIDKLDLVITVDTAVAHLAGSMGKAVLMFKPWFGDWRWEMPSHLGTWYYTMRMFSQREYGNWSTAIDDVALHVDSML